MTTWNDAMVAAATAAATDDPATWPDRAVSPAGIETQGAYWVTIESAAYLSGAAPLAFLLDPPTYRVSHATGVAVRVPWPEALDAMGGDDAVRVGDWSREDAT